MDCAIPVLLLRKVFDKDQLSLTFIRPASSFSIHDTPSQTTLPLGMQARSGQQGSAFSLFHLYSITTIICHFPTNNRTWCSPVGAADRCDESTLGLSKLRWPAIGLTRVTATVLGEDKVCASCQLVSKSLCGQTKCHSILILPFPCFAGAPSMWRI